MDWIGLGADSVKIQNENKGVTKKFTTEINYKNVLKELNVERK